MAKRNELNVKRSKARKRAIEKVRLLIGKNYSDAEILESMELHPKTLHSLKQEVYRTDKTLLEHLENSAVFSDYMMKSTGMVKRLHKLSVKFTNRGQWTALVAAIKQEKDIYDSVIKHGQDLGFIKKMVSESKSEVIVKGGLTFTSTTPKQMKEEISKQVQALNELAKGGHIEMRPELLGITAADVRSFVPASVIAEAQVVKSKSKSRKKVKLRLRKNL